MAIADALRVTDIELLDEQLRSVIDSDDPNVRAAVAGLAGAWAEGHEAVRHATTTLDAAITDAGLVLEHPARVALSTRLAGPGADADFLLELREWLLERDAAETRSGLAVEPRTLAALLCRRTEVDSFLHLDAPEESSRARAVGNVVWPWGRAARSRHAFNPYSHQIEGSIDLLREHWHSPVETLEVDDWTSEDRAEAHARLRAHGELLVRVPAAHKRVLRTALIDLHTVPVEVGPLWCYPEVLGVHDRGPAVEARLVLRESW